MKFIANLLSFWIVIPKYRRPIRNRILKWLSAQYNKTANVLFVYKYGRWLTDLKRNKSHFVPITDRPYVRKQNDVKVFTYYLAQFHAIPENDDAHGRGFTEWTNVASAMPQYMGHWQPHIPYDVGFYNLLDINVMRRQSELAKMYGVYGWCFYWYWFSGKQVLEKPLYNFLNSDIDMHFHFCWANENWSKLWDGGNKEIILEQKYAESDADQFFADILPFIKDARYEKIDNKPILAIYNIMIFPKDILKTFMSRMNELAKENGFAGFYFCCCPVGNFTEPKSLGFDALLEFPPHNIKGLKSMTKCHFTGDACFTVFDMHTWIKQRSYMNSPDYTVLKACFPLWDNTPRKLFSNGIVFEMDADDYKQWLNDIIKYTRENNPKNQQYIYINAWNEWGEGAHMEPDTRYGYRNLQILKECLENEQKNSN